MSWMPGGSGCAQRPFRRMVRRPGGRPRPRLAAPGRPARVVNVGAGDLDRMNLHKGREFNACAEFEEPNFARYAPKTASRAGRRRRWW